MSKTKEELEALKKEVEDFNKKAQELTMEELEEITGGQWYGGEMKKGMFNMCGAEE